MAKGRCTPCLIGALVLLVGAGIAAWRILRPPEKEIIVTEPLSLDVTVDDLIAYGRARIAELRNAGEDLEAGPCLENAERFPGWVIDIAHAPRQAVDDLPENQCSAYREGRATKFIELDPEGHFIRAYP